ncbi:MAG: TRAP transporter substrate-binding protein DctP [bacterium]
MTPKRLFFTVLVVLVLALTAGSVAQAAPVTIKIATVMPRFGPWATALARFAAAVKRLTKGQVNIKMYFGAVAGTEPRAIARMKANQIQGVAVASVGLTRIESSIRVIELPFLYRSFKEFRFVWRSMQPLFVKRFAAKGYRLLALASVGWVYVYSKHPVRGLADFARTKPWNWEHDPVASTICRILGIRGHRLALTAVLPSLQTGVIDTVYAMPHAVQALQWNTSISYMWNQRIAMAEAGILIREDTFKQLTPEHQKIVIQQGEKMQRYLNTESMRINKKATAAMMANGLKRLEPSAGWKKRFKSIRRKIWDKLKNLMYRPDDLKKVQALLTLCRNTSCSS